MENKNEYVTADLSSNLINKIKSFEERISEETNKDVVVIAYEKDNGTMPFKK